MIKILKTWFNWCFDGVNITSVSQSTNGQSTNVVQIGGDVWINGKSIDINEPIRSIKTVNGVTWVNGKRIQ